VNDTIYTLVGDMTEAPWVGKREHRLIDSGQMLFDRERHAEVGGQVECVSKPAAAAAACKGRGHGRAGRCSFDRERHAAVGVLV
jgi:hypothetical protein